MIVQQPIIGPRKRRAAPNDLPGGWFVVSEGGMIRHTTSTARQWLEQKLSPADQIRVRAFASQLACSQDNHGLLPLDFRSLQGDVTTANWCEKSRIITLHPSELDVDLSEYTSQLVGRFAQTLREPATKLGLFANLLTHGRTENQDFYEKVLFKEVGRINRLIENLSLLSHLLEPNLVSPTQLNMDQLVSAIQASLEPRVASSNLHISQTPNGHQKLKVNPKLIGVALSNLIAHMPRPAASTENVRIDVSTLGSWLGIALHTPLFLVREDDLFGQFEPFSQGVVDLELAIVRSIIGNHRGHITAKRDGELAALTLWLPIPLEWEEVRKG